MSLEFLETKYDRANYFVNMLVARATGAEGEQAEYDILRSEILSDSEQAKLVPSFVRVNRSLESYWAFIKTKFRTYAERRTWLKEQFTPLLDSLEFGNFPTTQEKSPSSTLSASAAAFASLASPAPTPRPTASSTPFSAAVVSPPQPWAESVPKNKRKVFIVHGHDNAAKQEVSRFVESLGLEAIILHEQASGGMTIIEKIEHYTSEADFALILYTPCDLGRGALESKVPARPRARQNVVFEHGYLIAKLSRKNVCALTKGQLETPSDISGVVYVSLDDLGAWKQEVVKELRACGYSLKF